METQQADGWERGAAAGDDANRDPETAGVDVTNEFEPITADSLKMGKGYAKELKKQEKEIDILKDRQQRDRILLNKNQCDAIEKLGSVTENDPAFKSLVLYQDKEWSQMLERHQGEEWQLLGAQRLAKVGLLPQLMKRQQEKQVKKLEMFHEREFRALKAIQAQRQIEAQKGLQLNKEAYSIQDRFRLKRFEDAKWTNIFVGERKTLAMKQDKQKEKLLSEHATQTTEISKFVQNSI